MYALTNKNWRYLFKAFNVKVLSSSEEASKLRKTILFISDDRLKEIEFLKKKFDENEVIVTELPSSEESYYDKNELKYLISKALGIGIGNR